MNFVNSIRNYLLDEEFKISIYKNKVNIVNYTSIVDFSEKQVIVKKDTENIIISGSKLSIAKLLIDEVLITGNIDKIELR